MKSELHILEIAKAARKIAPTLTEMSNNLHKLARLAYENQKKQVEIMTRIIDQMTE